MDAMYTAVMRLAEKHNFERFTVVGDELKVKGVCPICRGGEHEDTDTFAINTTTGAWNCKRGGCQGINGKREGSFRDLCRYFGEDAPVGYSLPKQTAAKKKTYVRPDPEELLPITEEIVTYFATRSISENTLKDWNISSDKDGNIVFPFYNEENELIFVKYRKPRRHKKSDGPKEWRMAGTEGILFGMNMTSFNRPLIITEGQIDAMSLYEAGITNVVSVPSGCQDTTWVDSCWDYLNNFKDIILFGDTDDAGLEMISSLSKRLGEEKCMIPPEYPEFIWDGKDQNRACKDANEILMSYGPEALKNVVDACEPAPIKGVLELSHIPFVDPTTVPRILTRIPRLDNMIGGLGEGGVSVISGKRGEGKSTLSGPIALNAIEQGYSVCAYSGELSAYKFLEWIMLQATESKYIAYKTDVRSGKNICYVEQPIQKRIKEWLEGKFYLYDNSIVQDDKQTDSILKVFEACARRYGTKLFICDNLMSALVSADEENKAQAKFTAQLKAFATKYKAHVLIIAHPRKTKADAIFQNDDVSGASAITNLADVVLNVEKSPKGIRVTKNRDFGTTGFINTCYDPANRRIFQADTGDRTVYGWNHEGIEIPEDQACQLDALAIDDGVVHDVQIF